MGADGLGRYQRRRRGGLSNAPRPHAALLFVDFLLSPDGQKLYEDLFFGIAQKDYGLKRWYPEKGGTLAQYEEALDGWHRLMKEITRKGGV